MRIAYLESAAFPHARRVIEWLEGNVGEPAGVVARNLRLWLARQEESDALEELAWLAFELWPRTSVEGREASEARRAFFMGAPPDEGERNAPRLYPDLACFLRLEPRSAGFNDEALTKEVNRKRLHRLVADAWKLEISGAENIGDLVRLARLRGLMTWFVASEGRSRLYVGGAARGHSRSYVHGQALCSIASLVLARERGILRIWNDSSSKEPIVACPDDPVAFRPKARARHDSALEAKFERWLGTHGAGLWEIERECTLIDVDGVCFLPDFSLSRRADGVRCDVEIVGFWTEDYLARKLAHAKKLKDRAVVFLLDRSSIPTSSGAARLLREPNVFVGDLRANPAPFFSWLEGVLDALRRGMR